MLIISEKSVDFPHMSIKIQVYSVDSSLQRIASFLPGWLKYLKFKIDIASAAEHTNLAVELYSRDLY